MWLPVLRGRTPLAVGDEDNVVLAAVPLLQVPLSGVLTSALLPSSPRSEAAIVVKASGAGWACLPSLPLVADGDDSAQEAPALIPLWPSPVRTLPTAASPALPTRLAVCPINKINEHCQSMQGSGAKLWFLRNQGLGSLHNTNFGAFGGPMARATWA